MEMNWKINSLIDCKDPENKWLPAKIKDIKVNPSDHNRTKVLVSYIDFSSKYDEWIDSDSDRIIPFFSPESSIQNDLKENNRVNVYDLKKSKWREARVVQIYINGDILVHWKGYASKFDEKIPKFQAQERIKSL
jgi:hypothetical protein